MKKTITLLFIGFALSFSQYSEAQIWRRVKNKVERKVEHKVEQKVDKKIDEIINSSKKKKKDTSSTKEQTANKKEIDSKLPQEQHTKVWRNYKFIPGDKIIFYDDLKDEEVGEFPSRWDLLSGGSEIIQLNGENAIMGTAKHKNKITPLLKEESYLPKKFTIEFDIYVGDVSEKYRNSWTHLELFFNSKKPAQKHSGFETIKLTLRKDVISGYMTNNSNIKTEETSLGKLNAWHHIAISYYNGNFKIYYDEARIMNLPRLAIIPEAFELQVEAYTPNSYPKKNIPAIKNVKIAEGGKSLYKRIVTDGRFVTHGILFDSGKATLKPQSFGVINKFIGYLKDNPDWKFEIIGHTDSDGSDQSNLTLSQKRAEAVKKAFVNLGINASRLTTSGRGESQPISNNSSPEGKANNRRVEFILKK